jgi:hypothetical protein
MSAVEIATEVDHYGLLTALARVQPSEGTRLDDDTWVWVQAFADFDYEYAWLLDVRTRTPEGTTSDYIAVFKGYDNHGVQVFRATWRRAPETFPKVPNLYAAMAWWVEWIAQTRVRDTDATAT